MAEETFEETNKRLNEKGYPYKVAIVKNEDLEYLDKNARYMKAEQFQNLTDNIKKDGGLSSLPFCIYEDGKYKILSGNHRAKANEEAGFTETLVLYTDKPLSKQEQIAIQLSHNSIAGEDDPVILKELWDELNKVDLKYYAGFDDKMLKELEALSLKAISEASLEYRTYTMLFLPTEADRVDEVFEKIGSTIKDNEIRLTNIEDYDRLLNAVHKIDGAYRIKNTATAFGVILDIFENHEDDLAQGYLERDVRGGEWASFSSITGSDNLPIETLEKLHRIVEVMLSRTIIDKKEKWKAIDIIADSYLHLME